MNLKKMVQMMSKPKYFLIILLSAIWFHLDSNFLHMASSFEKIYYYSIFDLKTILINILHVFRFFIPYLVFIIFSFFFYNYISLKTNNRNLNIATVFLIINFMIQLISLLVYQENIFNNFNIILLTLISLALFTLQFNQNYSQKTFIASLLLLLIILLWFGSIMTIWYFSEENNTANLYGGWPSSFEIIANLTDNLPRSSGIGRSAMIIFIPLALSFLPNKSKINKLHFCIYLWMFFLIMTTQSRIVLLGLALFLITVIIYIILSTKKLDHILSKILIIIIIPFVFYSSIVVLKVELLKKDFFISLTDNNQKGNIKKKIIRIQDQASFTSTRYDDWLEILEKNTQIIFGGGVMGDRWLINQSASNLFLYNYSSSGIVGLILFALVVTRSFFINFIIIFFKQKKINTRNYILLSASYIQYFLMGRSLVETSFGVFGVDFLIFFSAYFFTEHYYINQKLKK